MTDAEHAALKAENKRLRKALAPINAAVKLVCSDLQDSTWNPDYHQGITITIAEARAAADAARGEA